LKNTIGLQGISAGIVVTPNQPNGVDQMLTRISLLIARLRLANAARREALYRYRAEKARAALPALEDRVEALELKAHRAGWLKSAWLADCLDNNG
jgi:hypothetical protein